MVVRLAGTTKIDGKHEATRLSESLKHNVLMRHIEAQLHCLSIALLPISNESSVISVVVLPAFGNIGLVASKLR
jgi:hypothetical protein